VVNKIKKRQEKTSTIFIKTASNLIDAVI
jgi:hypothetical protein